jgi:hypothetical protein
LFKTLHQRFGDSEVLCHRLLMEILLLPSSGGGPIIHQKWATQDHVSRADISKLEPFRTLCVDPLARYTTKRRGTRRRSEEASDIPAILPTIDKLIKTGRNLGAVS